MELALRNPKAEEILVAKSSDLATKAFHQANHQARAKGLSSYQPNLKNLEAKAYFTKDHLACLRQYFLVTLADFLFYQMFEEKIQIGQLNEYLSVKSHPLSSPRQKKTSLTNQQRL